MTAIQPSEMSRELKLKLALSALLPDDIEVTELCNFRWRRGRFVGTMVEDNEWDEVMRLVHHMPENLDLRIDSFLWSCGIEVK